MPSLRQPGDGIVTTIGQHSEIYEVLHNFTPEYQQKIANKITALRKRKPYHPSNPTLQISVMDGKALDLEILNILLDFEVARRLQWVEGEEKLSCFAKEIEYWAKYVDYVGDMGKEGEAAGSEEKNKRAERVLAAQQAFYDFVTRSKQSHEKNLGKDKWRGEDKIKHMISDRSLLDPIPVASAIVGALKLSSGIGETCEPLMMTELPADKVPLKGKIYLEEEDCKLKYVFVGPKNTPLAGVIELDLDDQNKIYESDGKLMFCTESDRYKESRTFEGFSKKSLNIHKHTILKKLKENLMQFYMNFDVFFHAPEDDSWAKWGEDYHRGKFSAFEGRPDGGARERAVKGILEKTNSRQNSSREKIHQEYLEFFGGDSESEGSSYD